MSLKNNKEKAILLAQEVIKTEVAGIVSLYENLPHHFSKVCKLLLDIKGRIIVTGMGKSGHIGVKISSTLSSTGSPAFFVHPAEANHGDLGMIGKNDAIIAISNSGNTVELQGIISYANRFDIPLIAITTNKESMLARASNYILEIPKAKEACSLGLAPTTSTTNTLVLGDALAITLLQLRGFSSEDFKTLHPGGSLGKQLLKIHDIMHTGAELPIVNIGTKMDQVIINITSHKFGCVAVVNDLEAMVGIVTDGDIRRNMKHDFLSKSVEDIMTKNFVFATEDMNTSKALMLMQKKNITNLFIIKYNKPIGIIHIHDLLKLGVL